VCSRRRISIPNPLTDANSFALSASGEQVYLFSGDAVGNLTGYSHGFHFWRREMSVTFGRHVVSTGDEHFVAQITPSVGASNAGPRVSPVVVRQIMYHPLDLSGGVDNTADEFIESPTSPPKPHRSSTRWRRPTHGTFAGA
jgi:hypothetical protein